MGDEFSECKFIKKELWYYTYYDFIDNRKAIKRAYKDLSINGKQFYKWYVYANIHMNLTYKNAIWDYLNDYDVDGFHLLLLVRYYKTQ